MAYDALCTVTQLKNWAKVQTSGDDANLNTCILTASEAIGRYLQRENLGNVYSYNEDYSKTGSFKLASYQSWNIVLRHYPVATVTSVTMNGTVYSQLLTQAQYQAGNAGFYLLTDTEPRILKAIGLYPWWPVSVAYSAGYATNAIPATLQQAALMYATEIFRSEQWVMKKTVSVGGENVTLDPGSSWGMSSRVKNMIQPYRDINPFRMAQ